MVYFFNKKGPWEERNTLAIIKIFGHQDWEKGFGGFWRINQERFSKREVLHGKLGWLIIIVGFKKDWMRKRSFLG